MINDDKIGWNGSRKFPSRFKTMGRQVLYLVRHQVGRTFEF